MKEPNPDGVNSNNPSQLPACASRTRGVRSPQKPPLSIKDARHVALLCAQRASEKEACAVLNIPYATWMGWKSRHRHAEEFVEILDGIRGAKIEAHLSNIEKFSQKDWRASECYLEKTMPERFSAKAVLIENVVQPAAIVSVLGGEAALRKLVDFYCDKAQKELSSPAALKRIGPAVDVKAKEEL